MTPDVLISKLANLRAIATERHVPEVDLATIDLAIEHLRYFSVAPSHRLSDARMDGIYNAWRDMGDDVSYGDLMCMVEAATCPPGYVVVPVEPTDEMLAAMQSSGWMVGNYRAMIAAAGGAA